VVTKVGDEPVLRIYYGAADQYTCRADIELEDILDSLHAPALSPPVPVDFNTMPAPTDIACPLE
jgi:hypothetical protein